MAEVFDLRMRLALVTLPGLPCEEAAVSALDRLLDGLQEATVLPVDLQGTELPPCDGILVLGGVVAAASSSPVGSLVNGLLAGSPASPNALHQRAEQLPLDLAFSHGPLAAPLRSAVRRFAEAGGPVLGVCGGFQLLCRWGLLPGTLVPAHAPDFAPADVWVRVEGRPTPFTSALPAGRLLRLPAKQPWGRYLAPSPPAIAAPPEPAPGAAPPESRAGKPGRSRSPAAAPSGRPVARPGGRSRGPGSEVRARRAQRGPTPGSVPSHLSGMLTPTLALEERGQVVLRYCDEGGGLTPAADPYGADAAVAGICNEQGNVVGLMPHLDEPLAQGTRLDPLWDGRQLLRSLALHLSRRPTVTLPTLAPSLPLSLKQPPPPGK